MSAWKPYLVLCRVYLSLFAACSAATGFLLFSRRLTPELLIPVAAVFLLACGASALNQYQEQDIDARMERTRQRPLPTGAITPSRALSFSAALLCAGELLLADTGGAPAFALGLAAILWYNGIYTGLKRVTAFASVPGALVGAIPPAIGWAAAGGALSDGRLIAICFIFFMWQVPHFWLLILSHGREYEAAGLPSLTGRMSRAQISRVTFAWLISAVTASFALPLYGSVQTPLIALSFILPAVWLIWGGRSLVIRQSVPASPVLLFRKINLYLFCIMTLLVLDSIFLVIP